MSEARVSVVMPAYNAGRWLRRALGSVAQQSLVPLEVIVVDDGSTDDSARIAGAAGELVRCVRQQKSGAAAARNRGIDESRGDYVAFLDADDEWLPHHLERAIGVLERYEDLAWCVSAYERCTPPSGREARYPADRGKLSSDRFSSYFDMARDWEVTMNSLVIRREVFDVVGNFDSDLVTGEDLDLWFRIALRYPQIGYCPGVSSVYWLNPGSLTTQGHATIEAWMSLVESNARRAENAGGAVARSAEPLLMRWAGEVVRLAILDRKSDLLHEWYARFGGRLPGRWRVLSVICYWAPVAVWGAAVRIWVKLRARS